MMTLAVRCGCGPRFERGCKLLAQAAAELD